MARSTYIYVVTDGLGVISAFTVKHELVSWLRRNPAPSHRVTRVNDGPHSGTRITDIDITELLA
ncbi:hypothetical protein ACFO5K_04155 [Nocardia halotolerans]|uniref:Uncharacterized protein n=1 Tax=Nocardia halotolerans TaxID=1755878 RepID=A0ABV8VDI5_9NOCA